MFLPLLLSFQDLLLLHCTHSLKKANEIGQKTQQLQKELQDVRVTGSSANGKVRDGMYMHPAVVTTYEDRENELFRNPFISPLTIPLCR